MKCPYCGRKMKEGQKFCEGCGAKFEDVETTKDTTDNQQQKNGKAGLIIGLILFGIILIAGIIFGIVLLTQGGSKDNNEDNNESSNIENGNTENGGKNTNKSDKDLLKNVVVEFVGDLQDNNCLLKVTNNNDENINFMGTDVILHDSSKDVDIYEHYPIYANGLGAHRSAYISILTGSTDLKFDSFKAEYSLQKFRTTNHIDDITFTYDDDKSNKKITITYKNNSNADLDSFSTIVLFYKNEEIVGLGQFGGCFKDSNSNCIEVFEKGKEVTEVVKYPIAKDYKTKVDFDRFEIIVNEAYTKG